MRRPGADAGGFTLIEVLVAMTVMAVMAMMAWSGIDGIVRARDASQIHLERSLRMNTVIAQWEQDLGAIQQSTAVPALRCDGSTVRLTRRTPTGLQVVAWALRPSTTNFTWWRWASPPATTVGELQESWLRSQQLQGGEAGQLRTIDGLGGWQVYFYQGNAWSNCQSTGDIIPAAAPAVPAAPAAASGAASGAASAPPTAAPITPQIALPQGVRIVLTFAPGSGLDGSIMRDTLVQR
jgi:general secretion pathway protein J